MSSDEHVDIDDGKKYIDRLLFIQLLKKHKVVLEKSKLPNVLVAKDRAWKEMTNNYTETTGKTVTTEQLKKILNNMRSAVKNKTDMKKTGNKTIKLKDWEKELIDMINFEANPVFAKVPGGTSIGVEENYIEENTSDLTLSQQHESCTSEKTISLKGQKRKANIPETEVTASLSTTELQRFVLLKQLQVAELQIEREKLMISRLKNDNSTMSSCQSSLQSHSNTSSVVPTNDDDDYQFLLQQL